MVKVRRVKIILGLILLTFVVVVSIKPVFGAQIEALGKHLLEVLIVNDDQNPVPVVVKSLPTPQPILTEILRKKTLVKEIINEEMTPNSFTQSFEVDGYERITIYTECVAGKDIPLHVWSSIRGEAPRWYGLVDGDLKCGRPKTTLVQGREYMIQYLGDTPSVVAIRVYLVP